MSRQSIRAVSSAKVFVTLVPYLWAVGLAAAFVVVAVDAWRQKSFRLGAAACLALLLLGYCAVLPAIAPEIVTRDRVVGEYGLDLWEGRDRLVLRTDGVYEYTFTPKTGPEVRQVGNWRFRLGLVSPSVVLDEFAPNIPGADPEPRTWRLPIEEDYGMIRLWTSKTTRQFFLGAPREAR